MPGHVHDLSKSLLSQVAYWITMPKLLGPPSELIPFLMVSRHINMSCSFFTNHKLFARIFCSKFDVAAPLRRGLVGNRSALAKELRRRCAMMMRMRLANYRRSIDFTCSDADEHTILWGVYIMCIESDGKNLRQLREYAGIEGYLDLYMDSVLIKAHSRPGFTLETTDKSLSLWIMLFLIGHFPNGVHAQYLLQILMPYAYVGFKYDDGYCPWSCFNLPLPQPNTPEYHRITQRPTKPSIPSVEYPPDPLPPTTPFTPIRQVQGFKPRIMSQVVKLYDSTISIAVPLIANAAIIGLLARAQVGQAPVNPPLAQEHTRLTLPYMVSSGAFDTDYLRLVSCTSPFSSQCQPGFIKPGMFAGLWKGSASSITYDTWRNVVAGNAEVLKTAPSMLTPQAWFITEHHYIHPSCRLNEGRYEFDEDFDELVPDFGLPPTTTPSTAFLPRPLGSIGAPNGWVINHTGEGGRPGREYYYRTYLGGPYDPNQFGQVHGGMLTDGRSLNPHDEPLFRWLWREERDEGVNNRPGTYLYPVRVHDIILTGIPVVGDPGYGKYHLLGRVRPWDGMIIMLMEDLTTEPDRANYLFRGYITGGGNWVGKWRNADQPPENRSWERIFAMTHVGH